MQRKIIRKISHSTTDHAASNDKQNMSHPPTSLTDNLCAGKMCWAYGWGRTEGTPGVGYLKQVELETGSPGECILTWGKAAAMEWAVCAGKKKGHDTCQGDRLVAKNFQLSRSTECWTK